MSMMSRGEKILVTATFWIVYATAFFTLLILVNLGMVQLGWALWFRSIASALFALIINMLGCLLVCGFNRTIWGESD